MTNINKKTKEQTFNVSKFMANIAIALLIFGFGWYVGAGRVSFGNLHTNELNKNLSGSLDYSSVNDIYSSLKQKYDGQLDEAKLVEGLKSGLVKAAGDPYTEYMPPEDAKEFSGDLEGKFEGIGAELGKDKDNNIIIISPISGYPAEKAGLMPKDIIAEVNGESTYDLSISEVVDKIRGEKGTEVSIKVVRKGAVKEFKITRE